jgi:hypothetical protein
MRYRALSIIALIYKVLGYIILVLAVVAGCGVVAVSLGTANLAGGRGGAFPAMIGGGLVSGVGILLVGIFYALVLISLGEFISLFIDLEANTRATADLLRQLRRQDILSSEQEGGH